MVDPTALAKQSQLSKKKDSSNMRAFLFSLIGALVGCFACVVVDYILMGNITGVFYIFPGMTAYAFYQYFVERKDQRKFHILLILLACILATVLSVFVECMILYAPNVTRTDAGIISKTFLLYKENISNNAMMSYKETFNTKDSITQFQMSLIAYHLICAFMSVVAMLFSWVVLGAMSKNWEKKHADQDFDYSYSSRKKKGRNKRK